MTPGIEVSIAIGSEALVHFISRRGKAGCRHLAGLLPVMLIFLALSVSVTGQSPAVEGGSASLKRDVVAAAADQGIRFTATSGSVVEMRLEVFSLAGDKVFDSDFRPGDILDWRLSGSVASQSGLPDDDYLCLVTLRDLSGQLQQRHGIAALNSGRVRLKRVDSSQLSAAQMLAIKGSRATQQIRDEGRESTETLITFEDEAFPLMVTAHDGQAGQLTSTSGALTFRTGDIFAAKDVERLRITPEGNIGIGTDQPKAMLDVAGDIRSTGFLRLEKGIQFADGTVQTTGSRDPKGLDGNLTPDVAGTGTQNFIAKWTDNAGTLGNSLLSETSGGIELRPAVAGVGVNPTLTNFGNVAGFAQVSFYPAVGPNTNMSFSVVPRGTGAASNLAQFSIFNTDLGASPTNYEFAAMRARGTDFVLGTGKSGTGVNRPFMFAAGYLSDNITNNGQLYLASNGNVGVGTVSPAEKLDVTGNIKASGSLTGATGIFTGNLTVDAGTLHVDATNNRVGVGTATPTAPLDVVGDINTSTQFNIGGSRVLSTAGVSNLFAGVGAGTVNTGSSNAFFGIGAGSTNTTGSFNSFFGAGAGNTNTTASNNSFFGRFAGSLNTIGDNNSFFGSSAGAANTTGLSNSFFGQNAGAANTSGVNNSFFGMSAGLVNTTGGSNAFFGTRAGASNTTGSNNAFFGLQAGTSNTTGIGNAFFGRDAGTFNTSGGNNSFFGRNAGIANTTASDNSFFGESAGAGNTTGASNSFFGKSAGAANTTGLNNSFFGKSAGAANTTGNSNSFFGLSAGNLNTTGASNSFFGAVAGAENTTGANNSFFGNAAGTANTTGSSNSFFGGNAGDSNTTGNSNSFFGHNAGTSNTSGTTNSFFGGGAGQLNTTAGGNSFFGYLAGSANLAGSTNSFFGAAAGQNNSTGSANAFFGNDAGQANTTGVSNSFFGAGAGEFNTSGSSNAFFGTSAGAANTGGSNAFFGAAAGQSNTVGGSNAFFGQNSGGDNTTGFNNAFFGRNAGPFNTEGGDNTFVGTDAGLSNTTETDNTFVGAFSNGAAGITNATAIGANAVVTQSDSLVLGSGVKVGVGSSQPAEKLHVVGNVFIGGNPAAGANGLILKSPNGATCAKLTIDNAGALVTAVITCP